MAETNEMEYRLSLQEDYDRSLQLKGDRLLCYSPKKAKAGLPGQVVGEVLLKTPRPPKPPKEGKEPKPEPPSTGRFQLGAHRLPTKNVGSYGGLFYKKAGYACVGEGKYLCVLTDRRPFLAILLALLASAATAVTLVLMLMGPVVLTPEHPMPDRDENSLPVVGDEDDTGGGTVESEADGGFVRMHYTKRANVDLSDKNISMFFANPKKSNRSVVLELYVTVDNVDYLVAESGRVDSGYGLRKMTFNESVALVPTTAQKVYLGKYVVRFYDPDSGERAVVTTEIDEVIVTVIQ